MDQIVFFADSQLLGFSQKKNSVYVSILLEVFRFEK